MNFNTILILLDANTYLLSNGRSIGDFDEISLLFTFNLRANAIKQTPVMYES